MTKQIHVLESLPGEGGPADEAVARTLYLSCLTPQEAKAIVADAKKRKELGEARPRIVIFTNPQTFRRILTPLRLKLLSQLGVSRNLESVHALARDLGRDYHTVLKDLQLLDQFGIIAMVTGGPKHGYVPRVTWTQIRLVFSPSLALGFTPNFTARPAEVENPAFSLTEWVEALENIEDQAKVLSLGRKAYSAFGGSTVPGEDPQVDAWLTLFAKLLHEAFTSFDEKTLSDVAECLEWRGRFLEPALWESPEFSAATHQMAEDLLASARHPTLLQLQTIAHDLEAHVRPNLLRLLWIAQWTTTKSSTRSYSASQLDTQGKQKSIGQALTELQALLKTSPPKSLGRSEVESLAGLLESFSGTTPDQVSLDDLRNWVAHRDFVLWQDGVTLNLHPQRSARRLYVDSLTVTKWRRLTLGLMTLMYALKVMFLAHASARCGGLIPITRDQLTKM